jgi:REP element-mobilizing transposase RayT
LKKTRSRRKQAPHQGELAFPRHGGARPGAGRKPRGKVAGPSHAKRPSTPARFPLLVTQRLEAGLPSLRQAAELEVIRDAISETAERDGLRIVHFSVQSNHLHYICEARDAEGLTSGMRSLAVKLARRLNGLWKRTGSVFAERFHARALTTPTEVRHAIAYVLKNDRKHGIISDGIDPFSSGPWFDGWTHDDASTSTRPSAAIRDTTKSNRAREVDRLRASPAPVAAARTWLLRVGWRRLGLIDRRAAPGSRAAKHAQAREEARSLDSIQRSLAAAARGALERRLGANSPGRARSG